MNIAQKLDMVAINEARAFVSMCFKGQHTNKEGTPSGGHMDTDVLDKENYSDK